MAHALVAMGKNPEEARAYGMLIGETDVQLCTAHAVLTKLVIGTMMMRVVFMRFM